MILFDVYWAILWYGPLRHSSLLLIDRLLTVKEVIVLIARKRALVIFKDEWESTNGFKLNNLSEWEHWSFKLDTWHSSVLCLWICNNIEQTTVLYCYKVCSEIMLTRAGRNPWRCWDAAVGIIKLLKKIIDKMEIKEELTKAEMKSILGWVNCSVMWAMILGGAISPYWISLRVTKTRK